MTDDLSTKAREAAERLRESLSRSRKTLADDLLIAAAARLLDQLTKAKEKAEALLDEIAGSGVVFENEQVDYVEVQIDRDTWLALSKRENQKREGGTE